jgi:hypothetical protein
MSEYDCENEASIGRLEEVDLSDDDSDDSFNLLFNVLMAKRRQMKLTMSSIKL